MQKIADSLTDITAVWENITQSLNDVQTWNLIIAQPGLLDVAKPELLVAWTAVRDATQKYMDIITGKEPQD
jgi:hypothetical protein